MDLLVGETFVLNSNVFKVIHSEDSKLHVESVAHKPALVEQLVAVDLDHASAFSEE